MPVYELDQPAAARALFDAARFDEACYESVFIGWQPGQVFVDDPVQPRAALMARSYEYFLAGDPHTPLTDFLCAAPLEAEVFNAFRAFCPIHDGWLEALNPALGLLSAGRRSYRWQPGTPVHDWRAHLAALNAQGDLPALARLVPLDPALARQADAEPDLYPIPFIRYFWTDYARYAAHSYGRALLIGDQIVCTVFALCTSPRDAIIAIDTHPDWQRRGFGWLTASAFIEETLGRGLLPVWDCDEDNAPSYRLAEKLGFFYDTPFHELARPDYSVLPRTSGTWARAPGGVWMPTR
jgi:GNAT superfamily N-acetyltransferase